MARRFLGQLNGLGQKPFYRIAYAALFLVGLKLVWDGLAPWLGA